ncbi:MAG: oligosaccharide flippase family protein [Pseudomonadota bacterium]
MPFSAPTLPRRLARSAFITAASKLASGQLLAAAVPLLAAPIIGRLYTPSDYAPLAAFAAISAVVGTVSTLQLSNAIIAERRTANANAIAGFCLVLAFGAAVIMGILALILHWAFQTDPSAAMITTWLLWLPLATLAGGAMSTIRTLANRRGLYNSLSAIPIIIALVTTGTTLGLGFLAAGPNGPILGFLAGQATALIAYIWLSRHIGIALPKLSMGRIRAILRRHKRFPLYSLPSAFIGTTALQLPVYSLTALGAQAMVGAFSRARFFSGTPFTLIGGAIGEVYRQRASEAYRSSGSCRELLVRTALMSTTIGAVPVVALLVFGPLLFEIILGPNWRLAGDIASILAPMFMLRLIAAPLAHTLLFTGHQGLELVLNVCGSCLIGGLVGMALFTDASAMTLVKAYSFAGTLMYLSYLVAAWKVAKA